VQSSIAHPMRLIVTVDDARKLIEQIPQPGKLSIRNGSARRGGI
jgi:hypothetical protein